MGSTYTMAYDGRNSTSLRCVTKSFKNTNTEIALKKNHTQSYRVKLSQETVLKRAEILNNYFQFIVEQTIVVTEYSIHSMLDSQIDALSQYSYYFLFINQSCLLNQQIYALFGAPNESPAG